jgi:hypothetical protein
MFARSCLRSRQLRERFGIDEIMLVADRGMIDQTPCRCAQGRRRTAVDHRPEERSLRVPASDGALQLGFFDERNLFESIHGQSRQATRS